MESLSLTTSEPWAWAPASPPLLPGSSCPRCEPTPFRPVTVTSPPQPADDSLAISTAAAYRDFEAEFDLDILRLGAHSASLHRARRRPNLGSRGIPRLSPHHRPQPLRPGLAPVRLRRRLYLSGRAPRRVRVLGPAAESALAHFPCTGALGVGQQYRAGHLWAAMWPLQGRRLGLGARAPHRNRAGHRLVRALPRRRRPAARPARLEHGRLDAHRLAAPRSSPTPSTSPA